MASHPDFDFEKNTDLEKQVFNEKKSGAFVEETPIDRAPSPPPRPQGRLKKDWISRGIDRAFDVACVVVAILFLALGIVAAKLDQELSKEFSNQDLSFSAFGYSASTRIFTGDYALYDLIAKRLPTVLPIVYAILIGGTVKAWAHLEIERGTTLGTLEQLQGSQSVGGLAKTTWSLRRINLYTLVLACAWAFSPVGSQSALRCIEVEPIDKPVDSIIQFQSPDIAYQSNSSGLGSVAVDDSFIRALFSSSVYTSDAGLEYPNLNISSIDNLATLYYVQVENGTLTDSWNNMRIPKLESVQQYTEEYAAYTNRSLGELYHDLHDLGFETGWWPVIPNATAMDSDIMGDFIPPYASLIGVPTRLADTNTSYGQANLTAIVQASYHDFRCQEWLILSLNEDSALNSTSFPAANRSEATMSQWMSTNYHDLKVGYESSYDKWPYLEAFDHLLAPNNGSGFFFDVKVRPNSTSGNLSYSEVVFGSVVPEGMAITTCAVDMTYVEIKAFCPFDQYAGLKCRAEGVRASSEPPRNTNYTAFDSSVGSAGIRAFRNLTTDPDGSGIFTSTAIERWLWNPPATVLGKSNSQLSQVNLVPIDTFSNRLGLLWNTFFHATVYPSIIVGDIFNSTDYPDLRTVNITAEGAQAGYRQYVVNWGWMGMYFLTVAIMILASILTVLLRLLSKGPDILGYVSTLLRDSPFMEEQAARGSTLTGLERARLLENHRVRLLDVQADQDVGRIAIAQIGPDGSLVAGQQGEVSQVAAIHRGRLYE